MRRAENILFSRYFSLYRNYMENLENKIEKSWEWGGVVVGVGDAVGTTKLRRAVDKKHTYF